MVTDPPLEIVKFLHAAPAVFITRLLTPPEITISSVLLGIPADQFPALFQSELTAPVQEIYPLFVTFSLTISAQSSACA